MTVGRLRLKEEQIRWLSRYQHNQTNPKFSWFISKLEFSKLQIGHENIKHAFCLKILKLVTQKIDKMQLPTSRIHHP